MSIYPTDKRQIDAPSVGDFWGTRMLKSLDQILVGAHMATESRNCRS
jgi:hypothetical protein